MGRVDFVRGASFLSFKIQRYNWIASSAAILSLSIPHPRSSLKGRKQQKGLGRGRRNALPLAEAWTHGDSTQVCELCGKLFGVAFKYREGGPKLSRFYHFDPINPRIPSIPHLSHHTHSSPLLTLLYVYPERHNHAVLFSSHNCFHTHLPPQW